MRAIEDHCVLPAAAHSEKVFLTSDDQRRFSALREQVIRAREIVRERKVKAILDTCESLDSEFLSLRKDLRQCHSLADRKNILTHWLAMMSRSAA
jgi:hypothetical protein